MLNILCCFILDWYDYG